MLTMLKLWKVLKMNNLAEKYIDERFPHSSDGYKNQWRERFKKGTEWAYSDSGGRCILQRLAPELYPDSVWVSM